MSLEEEIVNARKKIVTDGYEMSVGEILSLYREKEIYVDPDYQRLFRWTDSQKTRFIESLLLGIPIPPIFVFQTPKGTWELVDGLQRLSTILELAGILHDPDGNLVPASSLRGTELLPSLAGKHWEASSGDDQDALPVNQQLHIKRARIRVEILKSDSDVDAKFELFQRLNTGGSSLSEQEVRNCVLVMLNREFFKWLQRLSLDEAFTTTFPVSETAQSEQRPIEMALRFIAYRRIPYQRGFDVNEYLDRAARDLTKLQQIDLAAEEELFRWTFAQLKDCLGENAFKRWDGSRHSGASLLSGFEVIAVGVASNRAALAALDDVQRKRFIIERTHAIWSDQTFRGNSGMGVRGTTRLLNLIPLGVSHFKP